MKKQMTRKTKRILALLLAVLLIIPMTAIPLSVNAAGNTTDFAGGTGTVVDPYLISTPAHLNNMRNASLSSNFKLINDINFELTDFEEGGAYYNDGMGWLPIEGVFGGIFDGNGYGIYGLYTSVYYEGGTSLTGLFDANNGLIVNLTIDGMVDAANFTEGVDYQCAVGSICGINNKDGRILNCTVNSYVSGYGENSVLVGGVAGINVGIIKNCISNGMVYAYTDNYVTMAGGIAGINYGSILNCANKSYVDGYCTVSGSVSSLGGIAGYSYTGAVLKNCYNEGSIWSNGYYDDEYKYYGSSMIGGIVGCANSGIYYCYNKGEVLGTSFGDGSVSGGVVGIAYQAIEGCYNGGSVSNTATGVTALVSGGVVGITQSTVTNSYNYGIISGGYCVGGLAGGLLNGEVSYCYNVGKVSPILDGNTYCVGWIVGDNSQGSVRNDYYNNEISTDVYTNAIGGGTHGSSYPLTDAQMKNMSSFQVLSTSVWTVEAGSDYPYPVLLSSKDTKVATSITVTTMPSKTEYELNEMFSNAGMVVTVNYDDGTSKTVTGYSWTTLDSRTEGKKTIYIEYDYFKTSIDVTVLSPDPIGIEIKTLPSRLNYPLGTRFSDNGIWVVCKYDNGSAKQITDYTVTGYDANKLGTQTITVTYKGFTDTFEVNVLDPEDMEIIKGDADFDLDVDSDDAIYLLYNVLFGDDSYALYQNCNFDGIGGVDSDDAVYLLYHVLFGEASYPLK